MVHTTWRVFLYALVRGHQPAGVDVDTGRVAQRPGPVERHVVCGSRSSAHRPAMLILALALGVVSITEGGDAEQTVQAVARARLRRGAARRRLLPPPAPAHPTPPPRQGPRRVELGHRACSDGSSASGRCTRSPAASHSVSAAQAPRRHRARRGHHRGRRAPRRTEHSPIAAMYILVGTVLVWLPVVLYRNRRQPGRGLDRARPSTGRAPTNETSRSIPHSSWG